jgi:hypothetical protein
MKFAGLNASTKTPERLLQEVQSMTYGALIAGSLFMIDLNMLVDSV